MEKSMEDKIEEIIEHFDFEKVLDVMKHLDWKWSIGNENRTPNIPELKSRARDVLQDVVDDQHTFWSISTGGFCARKQKNNLELVFQLTRWTIIEKGNQYA